MEKWKSKLFLMLAFLVFLNVTVYADIGVIITDVQISPEQPSFTDVLTIKSQGNFPGGTLWHDTSDFIVDDFSLQLDLYFTGGSGPMIPQLWSHDDQIDALPVGSYDLLVQTYWKSSGTQDYFLHDEYTTEFTVVPEPASFLIITSGLLFIRRKKRAFE